VRLRGVQRATSFAALLKHVHETKGKFAPLGVPLETCVGVSVCKSNSFCQVLNVCGDLMCCESLTGYLVIQPTRFHRKFSYFLCAFQMISYCLYVPLVCMFRFFVEFFFVLYRLADHSMDNVVHFNTCILVLF